MNCQSRMCSASQLPEECSPEETGEWRATGGEVPASSSKYALTQPCSWPSCVPWFPTGRDMLEIQHPQQHEQGDPIAQSLVIPITALSSNSLISHPQLILGENGKRKHSVALSLINTLATFKWDLIFHCSGHCQISSSKWQSDKCLPCLPFFPLLLTRNWQPPTKFYSLS